MNQNIKLIDVLGKKEDLHPDLLEYYEEGGNFPMVRHPLCYSVPHSADFNALINARYQLIKETAEEAFGRCDYLRFIWHHERPWRLNAFLKVEKFLKPDLWWRTLSEIWTDSENIAPNRELWHELLFERDKEGSENFMTDEERLAFKKLPQIITVYRGARSMRGKEGFSWTTDKDVACKFAERFKMPNSKGYIFTGEVNKSLVLGFLEGRGESEIVADFNDVEITNTEET